MERARRRPTLGLGLPAVFIAAGLAAQEISTGPAIGEIRVERVNVFDPAKGEDWWPFRAANLIHVMTREPVIRRELLLGSGEPWDRLKALESERNLRSLGLFRRADILPQTRPDGKSDLWVRTQDIWTLRLLLSVGTEGGESFFSLGASESNLLGYGKDVGFLYSQTGPKFRREFHYADPRFLGTRLRLSPSYSKTNRGDSIAADLARPFFSLETPYALGLGWSRSVDESGLFEEGAEVSKSLHRSRAVSAGLGLRLPEERFFTQRIEGGWHAERQEFSAIPETRAGTLPSSRELSGPTLGYSWIQPLYLKETYIDRMERVEDFNLGNELRLLAGAMGTGTGSDRERWIFNASDQQGLGLGSGRFALSQVGASGRVARGRWENALFFANLNLFWKTSWPLPQTWVAHLEGSSSRSLDGENQLVLGGSNGLRGYKNNSFVGGKAVLLNLENRFFIPGEYFHLLRFGGAVFFDSGAVVPEGSGISWRRFKSDVGAGLRLSSTRSRSGGVLRFDLAYALNPGPGSRWVISIRGQQAFQIFNSATSRVRQSPGPRL